MKGVDRGVWPCPSDSGEPTRRRVHLMESSAQFQSNGPTYGGVAMTLHHGPDCLHISKRGKARVMDALEMVCVSLFNEPHRGAMQDAACP